MLKRAGALLQQLGEDRPRLARHGPGLRKGKISLDLRWPLKLRCLLRTNGPSRKSRPYDYLQEFEFLGQVQGFGPPHHQYTTLHIV